MAVPCVLEAAHWYIPASRVLSRLLTNRTFSRISTSPGMGVRSLEFLYHEKVAFGTAWASHRHVSELPASACIFRSWKVNEGLAKMRDTPLQSFFLDKNTHSRSLTHDFVVKI